jgi:hypothetical protein
MAFMAHRVEVDQSIKIEQSGATVLAFANDISFAILISSDAKTTAYRALRKREKASAIAYPMLFAACLFLLLEDHLMQLEQVKIDVEYEGKSADIKSFLLEHIWKVEPKFEPERIVFRRIGKQSPAHKQANAVREGKDRNYRRVSVEELLRIVG